MKDKKKEKRSDIRSRALNLLSYRARSANEIRLALRERDFPDASIEETIDWLKEFDYLNDERFASDLAASRVRNKNWGARKIAFDLGRRGIETGIISRTVREVCGEGEESTAERAVKKWLGRRAGAKDGSPTLPLDRTSYASAFRYLQARGFPSNIIYTVLKTLKPSEDNDIE